MIRQTIIVIAFSFTAPLSAAEWYSFANGLDGSIWSADRETSENDGKFAWVWVRSDLLKVKSAPYRSTLELWRFDCKKRTSMTVSFIAYASNGTVAKSKSLPQDNPYFYEPVAPGTIGDTVMRDICAGLSSGS